MAEFVEIMGIKKRMDNYYEDCAAGCPLCLTNFCSMSEESLTAEDFKEAEKIMLEWAKEHPIVYPTWIEWLQSLGVIPYLSGYVAKRDDDGNYLDGHVNVNEVAHKPIPVDIAQKLGIDPKER